MGIHKQWEKDIDKLFEDAKTKADKIITEAIQRYLDGPSRATRFYSGMGIWGFNAGYSSEDVEPPDYLIDLLSYYEDKFGSVAFLPMESNDAT